MGRIVNWQVAVFESGTTHMVVAMFRHQFDAVAFAALCNEATDSDDYMVERISS